MATNVDFFTQGRGKQLSGWVFYLKRDYCIYAKTDAKPDGGKFSNRQIIAATHRLTDGYQLILACVNCVNSCYKGDEIKISFDSQYLGRSFRTK